MVLDVLSVAMIQGIDMKMIWGCKNYAYPPAVLELLVLEVGGKADKEVADWHKSQAFPQTALATTGYGEIRILQNLLYF